MPEIYPKLAVSRIVCPECNCKHLVPYEKPGDCPQCAVELRHYVEDELQMQTDYIVLAIDQLTGKAKVLFGAQVDGNELFHFAAAGIREHAKMMGL